MVDENGNYVREKDAGKGDWERIVYENLANAIVEVVCDDYVRAIVDCKDRLPYDARAYKTFNNFFNSQWYTELTNVDPDYLIQGLRLKARKIIEETKQLKEFKHQERE